jgi:hypothetical protein
MASTIMVFSGNDDGAGITGPFTNSSAAQAAFLAAASGLSGLNTINFEDQTVGFNTSLAPAPGVNVTLNATDLGAGYSGINNTTYGSLYGFDITPGGDHWLGFLGGSATFLFSGHIQSFGFWLTGIQDSATSSLMVQFNDGVGQTLNVPLNANGGAQFFGFTDPGWAITSVKITNTSLDAWGIDDVSYGSTPEPSSLLLIGGGAIGLAALLRRKRTR